MRAIGVLPYYDCNQPPACIWNDEEIEWIRDFINECGNPSSNLLESGSRCAPVIDILPNLTAVRCFGMSEHVKVPISDFDSLSDLYRFFAVSIDALATQIPDSAECALCYNRRVGKCYTGCLKHRSEIIDTIVQFADCLREV